MYWAGGPTIRHGIVFIVRRHESLWIATQLARGLGRDAHVECAQSFVFLIFAIALPPE